MMESFDSILKKMEKESREMFKYEMIGSQFLNKVSYPL